MSERARVVDILRKISRSQTLTHSFPLFHLNPTSLRMARIFRRIHALGSCDAVGEVSGMIDAERIFEYIGLIATKVGEEEMRGSISGTFIIAQPIAVFVL